MTKKEMFERIATINAADEEIVAFCEHEIELLANRKGKTSKPTKKQVENEGIKTAILEALAEIGEPVTAAALREREEFANYTPQKMTALLGQLVKAEAVVKTYEKKVAYFALA